MGIQWSIRLTVRNDRGLIRIRKVIYMLLRAKLSRELIKEICSHIDTGSSVTDAVRLSGVSQAAFFNWQAEGRADIRAGRQGVTLQMELAEEVENSGSRFKALHLARISNASLRENNWQASAWLLERKYYNEYGKKERVETRQVTKEDDQMEQLSVEDLRALAREERDAQNK